MTDQNGKGDSTRPTDKPRFDANWEGIEWLTDKDKEDEQNDTAKATDRMRSPGRESRADCVECSRSGSVLLYANWLRQELEHLRMFRPGAMSHGEGM